MKKSQKLGDIMTAIGLGLILIWFIIFIIDVFRLNLYKGTFWFIGMGISFLTMIGYYWFSSKSEKLENILGNGIIVGLILFAISIIWMMIKFVIKRPIWLIILGLGAIICTLVDQYKFSEEPWYNKRDRE